MLIENAGLQRNHLEGKTVLVTGAGGGIGYETARALVWMGANVIIGEIDNDKGYRAEKIINEELNTDRACFYQIDISDENQIDKLYLYVKEKHGFLDVIFNNATVTPLGAVEDVNISDWDRSYAVNLRAPVMLVQKFLPDMKARNKGTIVFVPSSGAAPYMGAYEVFKTAQVELCSTIVGELEDTGIYAYSIGPGLVKTETAQKGIEKVASLMNISMDEFYAMNTTHMLDAEHAGVGFAVSLVLAEKYNGQEIGSIQALIDAGILRQEVKQTDEVFSDRDMHILRTNVGNIARTYIEQYQGWLKRNVFERQWILRDFKKETGLSAEQFLCEIDKIQKAIEQGDYSSPGVIKKLFSKLKKYYEHQYKLLQSYEKNPDKLEENSQTIRKWIEELQKIIDIL